MMNLLFLFVLEIIIAPADSQVTCLMPSGRGTALHVALYVGNVSNTDSNTAVSFAASFIIEESFLDAVVTPNVPFLIRVNLSDNPPGIITLKPTCSDGPSGGSCSFNPMVLRFGPNNMFQSTSLTIRSPTFSLS